MANFTYDQIAAYLRSGFWTDKGSSAHKFNVSAGGTVSVNVSGLTDEGKTLASNALQAWTMVSGINFSVTTESNAQIVFDDEGEDAAAYATSSFTNGIITQSQVTVTNAWLNEYGTAIGSYSFQTYIHEIGHALGLGHAGNYNGSATYGIDNQYDNDSWQATIMSYFNQIENTSVDASGAYLVTPMIADILAIQSMYGTATTLRTGNTTYGENSTAGGYYDSLAGLSGPIAYTIIDNGGVDTLDFRSVSANQKIDLRAEGISNVGGLVGNLVIARGTLIENVISGAGNDELIGNAADNTFTGGGGNDVLIGGEGSDTAVMNAALANASIYYFGSSDGLVMRSGPDGSDRLHGVETVAFSNGSVATNSLHNYGSILEYGASHSDLRAALGTNQDALFSHLQNSGIYEGRQVTFDARLYIGAYQDLRAVFGTDRGAAAAHYINSGASEGRTPADFNALDYIASYADLRAIYGTNAAAGLDHFLQLGFAEGRGDNFDGLRYIASYGDLIASFGTNTSAATAHYITNGATEGRSATFDARFYLGSYADLRSAYHADIDAATYHFVQRGAAEGRQRSTFDALDYIASYADLRAIYGTNAAGGLDHFLQLGFSEGRGDNFDGLRYIASYGDLIGVLGGNSTAGTQHYLQSGANEGRATQFDPSSYLAANADLSAVFAGDLQAATLHYINHGYHEGRVT